MANLFAHGGWTPFGDTGSRAAQTVGLRCKLDVPYIRNANALQTLDIYELVQGDKVRSSQHDAGIWVLYIHGGAWRDPLVSSKSFQPALRHLISEARFTQDLEKIAGFASINYTLSPHPKYPPEPHEDGSRMGKHPDHIRDVVSAIAFLADACFMRNKREGEGGFKYAVFGHSCGATLAYQLAMDHESLGLGPAGEMPKIPQPTAIIGMNGLYDLTSLVHSLGKQHESLAAIYKEFIVGAFSEDEEVWAKSSPTRGDYKRTWNRGIFAAVAQSTDDTLVPLSQTEALTQVLKDAWSGEEHKPKIVHMEATGDHDDVWENGEGLAQAIITMMKSLRYQR